MVKVAVKCWLDDWTVVLKWRNGGKMLPNEWLDDWKMVCKC